MKKNVFIALVLTLFLFSCFQDSIETDQNIETTDLAVQKNNWKESIISSTIIENQKNISHYEFDVIGLQNLIDNVDVTYVWFDIGLNRNNQMTFTATGENELQEVVEQVESNIITDQRSKTDITVFTRTKNMVFEIEPQGNHMLPNSLAYQYLSSMDKAYTTFEQLLLHDGERVERFGLDPAVVQRMLNTKDISSLSLFLGQNHKNKLTTIFIGKDKAGDLLIDSNEDSETAGRAFDFTRPCPNQCNPPCPGGTVCVEECTIFGWTFCCQTTCPGNDTGDH